MSKIEKIGYQNSKYNSLKHGVFASNAVLAWEDGGKYNILIDSLIKQFNPTSAIEKHYLAELANAMWRKQRIRRNERAISEGEYDPDILASYKEQLAEYENLLKLAESKADIEEIASKLSGKVDKYEESYLKTHESLVRFLGSRISELKHNKIPKQTKINTDAEAGITFFSHPLHERLMRYETQLDRRMERMLSVLYKLKEIEPPEQGI